MGKIHQRQHRDLQFIWDANRFGDSITLISPFGIIYEDVYANVVYSQSSTDVDGFKVIHYNPKVEIPFSNLTVIPAPGEKWIVKIPKSKTDPVLSNFSLIRRPIRDDTFGFITLLLGEAEQVDT